MGSPSRALIAVGFTLLAIAGCEDDESGTPTHPAVSSTGLIWDALTSAIAQLPNPTLVDPSLPPVTPTQQLPTVIPQPSAGLQYPLTTQQALSLLGSGISVAGRVGVSGGEAMASKTTETVYEEQRVLREKCEYEYDTYKDEEVLKCRDEYVIEKVPVEKNVYAVDLYAPGRDISELTFSTPQKAIDQIVAYGATSWRRV